MDLFDQHPALLAIAIFLARIADVSLGTVRSILVVRGYRLPAALTGFFEVLVWLGAAGQVLKNLDEWYLVLAYASGFATGNWVGVWIESKIAVGQELVRAVSSNRSVDLAEALRERGFAVTELAATSDGGRPVEVLLVVERRRRVPRLLKTIREIDPDALWTISDVKRDVVPGRAPSLRKGV